MAQHIISSQMNFTQKALPSLPLQRLSFLNNNKIGDETHMSKKAVMRNSISDHSVGSKIEMTPEGRRPVKTESWLERMVREATCGFEDARLSKYLVGQIRFIDKANLIFGGFGLLLTTQSYQLEYDLILDTKLRVLLTMITVSCLINCFFCYFKNQFIIKYLVATHQMPEGTKSYDVWGMKQTILEYIFLLMAPNQFLIGMRFTIEFKQQQQEIFYHYNDFLTVIMACKFVYLLRAVLGLSTYDSDRGTRVARMFGAEPGNVLVLKCMMRDSPFKIVTLMFLGGVSFFGYIIMIAEGPISRVDTTMDYTSYINACWGTVATMTTVGYGDMFPRTNFGRVIMIICSMYGVIVVSLMVVTVTNFLAMTTMESASYTVMKKLEYKELIKIEALKILVNVNRDTHGCPKQAEERYSRIKSSIGNFRLLRRVYRNIGELSLMDEMTSLFNKTLGYLEDIREVIVPVEPVQRGSEVNTEACKSFARIDASSPKMFPNGKATSRRDSQKDSLVRQWERRVKRGSVYPHSPFKDIPGKIPSFVEAKRLVDSKIIRKSSFQVKETMSPVERIQKEKIDLPNYEFALFTDPFEPRYDEGKSSLFAKVGSISEMNPQDLGRGKIQATLEPDYYNPRIAIATTGKKKIQKKTVGMTNTSIHSHKPKKITNERTSTIINTLGSHDRQSSMKIISGNYTYIFNTDKPQPVPGPSIENSNSPEPRMKSDQRKKKNIIKTSVSPIKKSDGNDGTQW
jgi:hypothetical protein